MVHRSLFLSPLLHPFSLAVECTLITCTHNKVLDVPMGAQWAPVVTQAYFLINVHTKWLEEIAHQLSVNVKYITHTHTHHAYFSTHIYMHNKYIYSTLVKEIRENNNNTIIIRRNMREVEVDVLSGVDVGVASPLAVAVFVAMWEEEKKM